MNALHVALVVVVFSVFVAQRYYKWLSERRSLPPGPRGWPIIGNVADIPSDQGWKVYAEMAKTYGDMMYLEAMGQPLLILCSLRRASDLLDKRSSNNSDRPWSTMLHDLTGWKFNVALLPYGDKWKRRRRMVHTYFGQKTIEVHQPAQEDATRTLCARLLSDPGNFHKHIRQHSGSIILKTSYGYDAKTDDDHLIRLANQAFDYFNRVTEGGSFLVDSIPILRYLPSWFPGARFKTTGAIGKGLTTRLLEEPFVMVQKQMENRTSKPCFAVQLLRELEETEDVNPDHVQAIKDALGVAYAAGSDTTVSSVLTFILAMVLNPDVQKKAQEELDRVVGRDRLPTFSDQLDLPYIGALVRETVRWQPVTPLGIAHKSISEEVYDGHRIPAGTIITANAWAMTRDESLYPEPERFNPDRFIQKDGKELPPDPVEIVFGFGRRICPGLHFAVNSIWIAAASILSLYTISKELDKNGNEVTPEIHYYPGIVSQPKLFQCRFIPRSGAEKTRNILQSVATF